jgi:hypothetical protein
MWFYATNHAFPSFELRSKQKGKGFKSKETGNESIPKHDPIKQTKT